MRMKSPREGLMACNVSRFGTGCRRAAAAFALIAAICAGEAAFGQVGPAAPAQSTPAASAPVATPPAAVTPLAAPAPTAQPSSAAAAPGGPGTQVPSSTEPPSTSKTVSVGAGTLPRDLSPWGMFVNADIVVKVIMVGLLFASLVTWTVWLAKSIELASAKRQARAGLLKLQEARSLLDAERKFSEADDPVARLVRTASAEVALSGHTSGEGLKERVAWLLERLEVAAGRRIGRGMGVLASIGATAPFVGLLGTVWGIMNSFIGISNAHTTNLAVVAPGIAEALLATALGLFAAIAAVVIYNVFARSAAGYRMLIADGGALVLRLVSRDSERGAMPLSRAAE